MSLHIRRLNLLLPFLFVPSTFGQTPITNLNVFDSYVNLSSTSNVCVNTYVYNSDQPTVPLACCSSMVSSSERYYLSARKDLIQNLIQPTVPTNIQIKMSATAFNGSTCNPSAPNAAATGLSADVASSPGFPGVPVQLTAPNASDLNTCNFIQTNGSGFGICGQIRNIKSLSASASLNISKTHEGNFNQGQNGVVFTIRVGNSASGGATSGAVTVTETLPSGLTLASMSGAGWACSGNTCSRSDVLDTGASYPSISVIVNVAANAASPQVNSVSVSGGGSATATASDSAVITSGTPSSSPINNLNTTDSFINLSASTNLCVNTYVFSPSNSLLACCSSSIAPFQPYYLSARQDLISNSINPSVPANILVKISGSTTNGSACNPGTPGAVVPSLSTTLASTAGGSGTAFPQFAPSEDDLTACKFIQSSGSGFGICRQVHALGGSGQPSALSISKTHIGNLTQGQTGAQYTVLVSNAAAAGPTNGTVTVTETVPSGLTLVSMNGSGWACVSNTCSRTDALNAGSSYSPITVIVNVAANAASPQVNAVSVSGGGSPGASATDSTVVDSVSGGSAPGVAINNLNSTDTVVNFSSLSSACVNAYVFDQSQKMLACCSNPVQPGQPYFFSARNDLIINTITPGAPSNIQLKLSASAGNCDPATPGNAISGLSASLGSAAGVTGTAFAPAPPTAGDLTACRFIQTNGSGFGICHAPEAFSLSNYSLSLGSGQAAAAKTIELPIQLSTAGSAPSAFQADLSYDHEKLTFISARKGEGAANAGKDVSASPNGADIHLTSNGNTQSPIVGANLAYATFQLSSQFTSGVTAVTLKNCLVTAGGVLLSSGCSGGNVTSISLPASLSILKSHNGNLTQGQSGAVYTITVSNAANAGPTNGAVTMTETVPPGMSLVSMSGTGWTCNGNTCTRNDVLNAGASYPFITATVNVASSATSPQVNTASVSGGGSATVSTSDSTVISAAGASVILPANFNVNPNDQVVFPLSLSSPAPSGGVFVTLSVSDLTVAALNTVTVLIPEGQISSTRVRLTGLAVGTTSVHASAQGFADASTQVQVGSGGNVVGGNGGPAPAIVLPSSITLYAGDQIVLPVTLSVPASPSGVFITLSVSNGAVASLNTTSVIIGSGESSSMRVRLNGIAPGTATITASAPGYPTVTQQVQVLSH